MIRLAVPTVAPDSSTKTPASNPGKTVGTKFRAPTRALDSGADSRPKAGFILAVHAANFIQMGNSQGDAMVDLNNSVEDVFEIATGGSLHGSLVTKSAKTPPSMDRL